MLSGVGGMGAGAGASLASGGGGAGERTGGGGHLKTHMGTDVKNRQGGGEFEKKMNRYVGRMENNLKLQKAPRKTRFREVFGDAVNVYSNLLDKFKFDELFKDDDDP
jgi:hypothetical protein